MFGMTFIEKVSMPFIEKIHTWVLLKVLGWSDPEQRKVVFMTRSNILLAFIVICVLGASHLPCGTAAEDKIKSENRKA